MRNKRICVIGAGNWGKNHIRTLDGLGVLAGIVETDQTHVAKIKSNYPGIEFFNSVRSAMEYGFDGFTVATPPKTHFEIGQQLLVAGYPVLIEKPLALNAQDAKTLVAQAEKSNVTLMVGHLLLFHPAIQKIKNLLSLGRIGSLQYIYSNRLNLGTVRTEENVFWSFAPHDISIFQYLIESDPIHISSRGAAYVQEDLYDTTMTTLTYDNNIKGHIYVSWLHPFKEHRLVVVGDKGMIRFEDSSENKPLMIYDKGIDWEQGKPVKRDGPAEIVDYKPGLPLTLELEYFLNHLKKPPAIADGKNGLSVVRVLEQATQSMAQVQEKI
jgi:UDP-2-acetamido-3-amino-2,3-dideoxy-glucuronate N-acetyltransferase